MKWYCALNEAGLPRYGQLLAAACESARRNSDIVPHLLYDGSANHFIDMLQLGGVNVIKTEVSFKKELEGATPGGGYNYLVACGAYLRFQVPHVEQSDEWVLYTDVDVIFKNTKNIELAKPLNLAACAEIWTGGERPGFVNTVFNSGVMVMNVSAFRDRSEQLLDLCRSNSYYFHGRAGFYDQGALNAFFHQQWEALKKENNVRPFMSPLEEADIIHFHGTKPYEVELLAKGIKGKASPTAEKLFSWAPERYSLLLKEFNSYVPEWWWGLIKMDEYRSFLSTTPI